MWGGVLEERPLPAHCGDNMNTRRITFTSTIGEYEEGKTYTLGRALARRFVREGVATLAAQEVKPKKKTTKKVVKERAATNPDCEQAAEDA